MWPRNFSCLLLTLGVGHGVDSGVGDMICPFDVQHYAITGSSKSMNFVLHISGDNPGLAIIEQNSDTSWFKQSHFSHWYRGTPPQLFQLPESNPSQCLAPQVTSARCHHGSRVFEVWHMDDWATIDLKRIGCASQFDVMYSVYANNKSNIFFCCCCYYPGQCTWALGRVDSRRAMSSAKSRPFSTLVGCLLDLRWCVTIPESISCVLFFRI